MIKVTFRALLLMALGLQASLSATSFLPVGSNLGYGDASNKNTIFNVSANPAWLAINLGNQNDYGFGISTGVIFSQNAAEQIHNQYTDHVFPILKKMSSSTRSLNSLALATQLKTELLSLVATTRQNFYAQIDAHVSVPVKITAKDIGSFGLEFSSFFQSNSKVISSGKAIDIDIAYLFTTPNASRDDILTNGVNVQTAIVKKVALYQESVLTYGNQVYKNHMGNLSVGVRAKLMQANLWHSINNLDSLLKSNNSFDSEIRKNISDFNKVGRSQTALGLDAGLLWTNRSWQLGFSLQNINSPTFKYNSLGLTSDAQGNIEVYYASLGQVSLNETVSLKPQGRIEGAVYNSNQEWLISGAIDTNKVSNLLNNPYQWASVSASYSTSSTVYIPDVRISYRTNFAGNKETLITPGVSWGFLNLDITIKSFKNLSSLVSSNKIKAPETLGLNLSLDFQF